MNTAICTLFENHYHYGLAALSNSLYKNGFRGSIYAGYRGSLPSWSSGATESNSTSYPGIKTLTVTEGLQIHFVPVNTNFHLANYKPDFMLDLWKGPASDAEAMIYFDPDIVIKCKWSFYERWLLQGVALVHEIISNDMPVSHPIRKEWEAVIAGSNRVVTRQLTSYINSGFCGVHKKYVEFIEAWSLIMRSAVKDYNMAVDHFSHSNRTDLFFAGDQDAFNIAAMCSDSPISELGPEGMDFIHGGWTMSHAIGSPKPWKKKFISSALSASPPTPAEKAFWLNAAGPISIFSADTVRLKRLSIGVASFIGRFYRRY